MPPANDFDPLAAALGGDDPLRSALDRMPVPMWVADRRGHVRWLNAAARSLVGDRIGVHFSRFVGADSVANARELFARKVLGRSDSTVQRLTLNTIAGAVDADMTSVPLRSGGEVIGVMSLVRTNDGSAPSGRRPMPRLTPRQHQVLELLAQGRSTSEIAETLQVAEATARNHIRLLLAELRVRTRLEAVVVAFRNDWL